MQDLRFSHQCYLRFKSTGMPHCEVGWVVPNVSKYHSTFNFRVKQSDYLTLRWKHTNPLKCHTSEDLNLQMYRLLFCYIPSSFFFFNQHYNPLLGFACSTIVELSQQEGSYGVLLPARQTPSLEDQWLERSKSRHSAPPASETTQANPSSGRWNYGRKMAENIAESGGFHVTFGFFYMP